MTSRNNITYILLEVMLSKLDDFYKVLYFNETPNSMDMRQKNREGHPAQTFHAPAKTFLNLTKLDCTLSNACGG